MRYLVPILLLAGGCVTATTTSREVGGGPYAQSWVRDGRVQSVREVVRHYEGDPAGGAMAGAVIGGLFGNALEGPYGSGAATLFGAIGGAMVGAAASQGHADDVYYEVLVQFEDGGYQTFTYRPPVPFRVGDFVRLTPQGLTRP